MGTKIPLKDGTEMEVPPTWIAGWCELYFKDDVYVALHKCRIWNLDHPDNRKTKRGLRKHIGHFMKDCRLKPQVRMVTQKEEPRPDVSRETRDKAIAEMRRKINAV